MIHHYWHPDTFPESANSSASRPHFSASRPQRDARPARARAAVFVCNVREENREIGANPLGFDYEMLAEQHQIQLITLLHGPPDQAGWYNAVEHALAPPEIHALGAATHAGGLLRRTDSVFAHVAMSATQSLQRSPLLSRFCGRVSLVWTSLSWRRRSCLDDLGLVYIVRFGHFV